MLPHLMWYIFNIEIMRSWCNLEGFVCNVFGIQFGILFFCWLSHLGELLLFEKSNKGSLRSFKLWWWNVKCKRRQKILQKQVLQARNHQQYLNKCNYLSHLQTSLFLYSLLNSVSSWVAVTPLQKLKIIGIRMTNRLWLHTTHPVADHQSYL